MLISDKKPVRFRIEIEENCEQLFVFEASSYKKLKLWTDTLFVNWEAGAATRHKAIFNQVLLQPDFWRMNAIRAE